MNKIFRVTNPSQNVNLAEEFEKSLIDDPNDKTQKFFDEEQFVHKMEACVQGIMNLIPQYRKECANLKDSIGNMQSNFRDITDAYEFDTGAQPCLEIYEDLANLFDKQENISDAMLDRLGLVLQSHF